LSALRQSHWYEYLLRFVLGGLATVMTGLIAEYWGPEVGGLFLAFPAVFCASATLIEKHERARKQKVGLNGFRRGTDATALDSSGAAVGSIGLGAFALVVWLAPAALGFAGLVFGAAVWAVVSIAAWYLQRHLRSRRSSSH
jgi:hypothetical protein